MLGLLKRLLVMGLLCALALAMACDSSSNGGGGATAGYTQADLGGEWALRGSGLADAFVKFDATGAVLRWKTNTQKLSPWVGQVVVGADGSLSGKVYCPSTTPFYWLFVFDGLRFTSQGEITGKLGVYAYYPGGGTVFVNSASARMTFYR